MALLPGRPRGLSGRPPFKGRKRSGLALLLAFLILFGWVLPAKAALWIEFEPPQGLPGTEVEGRTAGEGALTTGEHRKLAAFLWSERTGYVPIGHLRVNARGNGTIHFTVPDVGGGDYSIYMNCKRCYGSEPRAFVGEFSILGARVPVPEPKPPSYVTPTVTLAALIILLALVFWKRASRVPPVKGAPTARA